MKKPGCRLGNRACDPDRARTCNLLLSVPATTFVAVLICEKYICGLDCLFTLSDKSRLRCPAYSLCIP